MKYSEAKKMLEFAGFKIVRQGKGSHVIFEKNKRLNIQSTVNNRKLVWENSRINKFTRLIKSEKEENE